MARKVLLDALDALQAHRNAIVLAGAQAIYLRIGENSDDLALAPFTTDADLTVDPRNLRDTPLIPPALGNAGFVLTIKPGTWTSKGDDVHVDLLVPHELSGSGRRGARLGPHGNEAARKATGLEAAVVDHDDMTIKALTDDDPRTFRVAVAGCAALLVAKLHKLWERREAEGRLNAKDALDILRILRHKDTASLAAKLAELSAHDVAGASTRSARDFLVELFSDTTRLGPQLAARAVVGVADEEETATSSAVLGQRLLDRWRV